MCKICSDQSINKQMQMHRKLNKTQQSLSGVHGFDM